MEADLYGKEVMEIMVKGALTHCDSEKTYQEMVEHRAETVAKGVLTEIECKVIEKSALSVATIIILSKEAGDEILRKSEVK